MEKNKMSQISKQVGIIVTAAAAIYGAIQALIAIFGG